MPHFNSPVTFKGGEIMDYGMSFHKALRALESDLERFNAESEAAMEVLTITKQAAQSAKTDQANNTLKASSTNSTQTYVERARSEADKVLKTIQNRHNSTLRVLSNTWESNDQFIGEYSQYQNQYKLVDEIVVINWSYGHNAEQYLLNKLTKLRAVITTNASYLNNWQNIPQDALINQSGKTLDKSLVAAMGAPSSIDTANEYMGHLRTQFRGRKSEKTYRGEMVNVFINEIRSFAKTKTSYNQNINAAERIAKTIASTCEGHMRNASMSDEDKQHILKLQKNLDRMIVLYANMIYFSYRLAVEYILNRRVLVTKLYEK